MPSLRARLLSGAALPALALLSVLMPLQAQAEGTPLTARDLVSLMRVGDPAASPDGHYVAFTLRETDLAANRGRTALWLLDLTASAPVSRRLTQGVGNDSSPRWGPDSRTLYFLSARSGSSQVWRLSLDGGEALQITHLPLDVATLQVSPAGDRLALTMSVFPGCADLKCSAERLSAPPGAAQASGQLYDQMFVRHWDTWANGTRSHLFTVRLESDGTTGAPTDVSGRIDGDVPAKPFGGAGDFAFSPDGRKLAFSARLAARTEPWSTNFDIYEVPADGSAPPRNLSADNPAWDAQPHYLANGDLAWRAQDRPGFEADRFHIVIRDAASGARRNLTAGWDRSVAQLGVTADNRQLLAVVSELGQHSLYLVDPSNGTREKLVGTGNVSEFSATRGGRIVIVCDSLAGPADLYALRLRERTLQRLTSLNHTPLAARSLSEFEQFEFPGWHDESVHGYVMKPYGFASGRRYPVAFVIHGGPQSSMGNAWSYRWNPQVFAGAGYAVVFIDFHGSEGYGQAFTDSISGDWGGKPLEDLQKGLAAALARYPWLDGKRVCALGASYGGYMINWIAGRWPDRFACLVDHDGVFDQRTMYYSTEELWFPEWENGGTYFDRPENYERFNPANYVTAWRTPMLVIHGGQDFRVPLSQGLSTFTALQRRGIESRLLYFPDENHWVLKPLNSLQWYDTVLAWLNAHLK